MGNLCGVLKIWLYNAFAEWRKVFGRGKFGGCARMRCGIVMGRGKAA